ncbi:hypothetical protein CMI47_12725 [Candidatus Pacearchaeota archaeon]|nr:hypothetical protein [Candidatus Pacearchaeota archaeon]|tara:strand:+ start:228 stop:407 length:180 start_codon:yes stop_codon:yes gene_type:complete
MRPTEIEKLQKFRESVINLYTKFGQEAREKIWINHEVKSDIKRLIRYYDELFKDELLTK